MSLRDAKVEPAVPVSDMTTAREFYETKLGLTEGRPIFDGGITYQCGAGREIHIYPSPASAGKSGSTVAAWEVVDIEKTVGELTANGVAFEHYDTDRLKTNEWRGSRTPTETLTALSNSDPPVPSSDHDSLAVRLLRLTSPPRLPVSNASLEPRLAR
jgi:catechol 2,3-dioxygenase-like lactoylglutathione lyase family enzyme